MKQSINVANIKCGGCANSISSKLAEMEGISDVKVDVESGNIEFDTTTDDTVVKVKDTLAKMGYPEGDPTLLQTAKSYVSCAVGRMK